MLGSSINHSRGCSKRNNGHKNVVTASADLKHAAPAADGGNWEKLTAKYVVTARGNRR
jgi:hypothetical protein